MTTVTVTLNGQGGQLDQKVIVVTALDSAEISNAIFEAIDDWMLSPGDTILIGTETPSPHKEE